MTKFNQNWRQNYSLVEQKGMVFDIFINFWWKYQVYKYINLIKKSTICVKVDENVKIDDKIKIDEKVKIDQKVKIYQNVKFDENVKSNLNVHYYLHLPHRLPMAEYGI